ncbi:hypothetical protein BJV78DRAFT_742175 [Lactifluus subvellereus]|nr:hypothetical protein BJV78DRAFT_742175 [Lactifluus subvellereus]
MTADRLLITKNGASTFRGGASICYCSTVVPPIELWADEDSNFTQLLDRKTHEKGRGDVRPRNQLRITIRVRKVHDAHPWTTEECDMRSAVQPSDTKGPGPCPPLLSVLIPYPIALSKLLLVSQLRKRCSCLCTHPFLLTLSSNWSSTYRGKLPVSSPESAQLSAGLHRRSTLVRWPWPRSQR